METAVPLAQRAIVTFVWLAATVGVFLLSMVLPDGIGQSVALVVSLSMGLTFLALLFLLIAEAIAPVRSQGPTR